MKLSRAEINVLLLSLDNRLKFLDGLIEGTEFDLHKEIFEEAKIPVLNLIEKIELAKK